jgi:3-oxoacyl-[acyl-carrier protein] reductase
MDMQLQGRTALVTGASVGIGRGIALALAAEGVTLALTARRIDKLRELAGEITAIGGAVPVLIEQDMLAGDAARRIADAARAGLGRVDILVNNAGITRDSLVMRMKDDQWDSVLEINLKGAFVCTRAAVRPMVKARYGRIINIASIVGARGNAGQANYAASKGGLIALTKTVAQEFASRDITCNAVAPGVVDTAMFRALPEETQKAWMEQVPLGRAGTPEDVAECVAFFCLPGGSYITGQVLHLNGGLYM